MRTAILTGTSSLLGGLVLAILAAASASAAPVVYSGAVLAVDEAAGTIVVGDMGPMLASGKSEIRRRTVRVTPSTEFNRVARAEGAAPSGWIGGYVETSARPWSVRVGDWVTVTLDKGSTAVRVTVVDTGGS